MFQVTGGEDTDKLQAVLGDYSNVSSLIMRANSALMGVERQPATPLPSSKHNNHFDRSRDLARHHVSDPQRNLKPENRTKVPLGPPIQSDVKVKSASVTSAGNSGANRDDKSSLSNATKLQRNDHHRSNSQSSTSSQKSVNSVQSQKMPKPEVVNHSVKKEQPVTQSTKQQPVSSREPVLQSLNQELIGQSKQNVTKSNSKPAGYSDKVSAEGTGKFDSVLKEKEENRNINSKVKSRPKLHIPEVRNPINKYKPLMQKSFITMSVLVLDYKNCLTAFESSNNLCIL